jgi:cell wall-associated NlpC family hydrolase
MPTAKKCAGGKIGVIVRNVVPLRAEAKADAEQVSQAIIGDHAVIEGGHRNYFFIRTWDAYRGWIDGNCLHILDPEAAPYASTGPVAVIRELIADIHEKPHERSEIITKATIAAQLEVSGLVLDWVELRLPKDARGYVRKQHAKLVDKDLAQTMWLPEPEKLVETAMRFVGVPYMWGGTTPFGIDCSGFVQLVHRIHGVTLFRDACLQAGDPRGLPIQREEIRAGDLVFFGKRIEEKSNTVTHVGIAIDRRRFVHAESSSGVAITSLDDPRYSSIYWGARRMRLATLDLGGGAP